MKSQADCWRALLNGVKLAFDDLAGFVMLNKEGNIIDESGQTVEVNFIIYYKWHLYIENYDLKTAFQMAKGPKDLIRKRSNDCYYYKTTSDHVHKAITKYDTPVDFNARDFLHNDFYFEERGNIQEKEDEQKPFGHDECGNYITND